MQVKFLIARWCPNCGPHVYPLLPGFRKRWGSDIRFNNNPVKLVIEWVKHIHLPDLGIVKHYEVEIFAKTCVNYKFKWTGERLKRHFDGFCKVMNLKIRSCSFTNVYESFVNALMKPLRAVELLDFRQEDKTMKQW